MWNRADNVTPLQKYFEFLEGNSCIFGNNSAIIQTKQRLLTSESIKSNNISVLMLYSATGVVDDVSNNSLLRQRHHYRWPTTVTIGRRIYIAFRPHSRQI